MDDGDASAAEFGRKTPLAFSHRVAEMALTARELSHGSPRESGPTGRCQGE